MAREREENAHKLATEAATLEQKRRAADLAARNSAYERSVTLRNGRLGGTQFGLRAVRDVT